MARIIDVWENRQLSAAGRFPVTFESLDAIQDWDAIHYRRLVTGVLVNVIHDDKVRWRMTMSLEEWAKVNIGPKEAPADWKEEGF